MSDIAQQLEQARKSLLDLTLRNKLLNFRELKRSTVTIVDEIPAEIYDTLVFDGNSMNFQPDEDHPSYADLERLDEADAVSVRGDGTQICELCKEQVAEFQGRKAILDHLREQHQVTIAGEEELIEGMTDLWELPDLGQGSDDRHVDTDLQTKHEETNLQKRLYNIHNRAEALIEDAGYNALHLAVGFLEWTEADAHEDPNSAPLILIPVSLERKGAQSAFTVSWSEEEVTGNLSLKLKLSEQGFDLPEFEWPESKADVRRYLEDVEESVEDIDGWSVTPEVQLGFFDYTKFVMFQDLDPESWSEGHSPADHELIQALLDPDSSTAEPEAFDPGQIDESLAPQDVHHVMDADPSQIAAIEDVKRGRNMVIEGPPGTGKSQTIVNMIAELLAEDKSVLFVSEKLAALDVVKERLDTANIGDFALELHSDKASKSDFLDELERLAKVGSYDADVPQETFRQIEQYRSELNAYADALGTPFGALECTPYSLFGQKEYAVRHFETDGRSFPRASIGNPREITPEEREEALAALRKLNSQLPVVAPVGAHPWRGCHPGQLLPQDRQDIGETVHDALDTLHRLQIHKAALEDEYGVRETETLGELEHGLAAAELLEEGENVSEDVLRNSEWNERPPEASELIELLERFEKLEREVGSRTDPSQIDTDLPTLLSEYQRLHGSMSRLVRPEWYRLKGRVASLYTTDVPDSDDVVDDIESLIELQDIRAEIANGEARGLRLFGALWNGTETDTDRLRRFSDWMVEFRRKLVDDVLEQDSIEYLAEGHDESIEDGIAETREATAEFEAAVEELAEALHPDESIPFGQDISSVSLEDLERTLERWQGADAELDQWARFDQSRVQVDKTVGAPLLKLTKDGTLGPDDLVPCFEGNLADSLLQAAFEDRPALAGFDGNVQRDRIETFQELDEETFNINRKRVLAKLAAGTPDLMQGASKSSQAGLLMHEFGKQRMHKPIRVLMEQAGELIQQLKPCFMMSPLSVAKYLDPESMEFDVVIFDEASQVKPQDALGTIMRGDQIVLFGDTKQLPPTSFFDQVVDQRESEDEWEFNVQDVESVLDLGRSAFPSKRLKWHYRSKHESLIAVSNQEFYDNDLLVYPSPVQDAEDLGLTLNHLPDTVYDRGGSSVNREEARAVAEAAVAHYRETPSKSLGIGTFSQTQQEAVREEIERLRKENPEIDEYFSRGRQEHFFVKNLERIQGDERDVIFISIGYGYDADGTFSHNFGPLNHSGGWRRLNVLITRAREQCVVFSNFTADAIDASASNARGVQSLKVFLDYAENRNLETLTDVGAGPDSPFERSVIEFLRENGYDVHPQVGCAGFRIDLAIPDPENPGRYVLGIECDGASYHSSPVARARDRQREAILEDRGWVLHRIWSTDWYRDRETTKERLIAAVQDAIQTGALDIPGESGDEGEPSSDDAVVDGGEISIEDLQEESPSRTLDDLAQDYQTANGVPHVPLGEYNVSRTVVAAESIVEDEGPIHREVLETRIVEHSDVTRRGKKVQLTIEKALQTAVNRGVLDQHGEFYTPPGQNEVPIRRRDEAAADIEWIADEEIAGAIDAVLDYQYATARDELISQTARVLGFDRTGQRISRRIGTVIDEMESEGLLEETNGLLEPA